MQSMRKKTQCTRGCAWHAHHLAGHSPCTMRRMPKCETGNRGSTIHKGGSIMSNHDHIEGLSPLAQELLGKVAGLDDPSAEDKRALCGMCTSRLGCRRARGLRAGASTTAASGAQTAGGASAVSGAAGAAGAAGASGAAGAGAGVGVKVIATKIVTALSTLKLSAIAGLVVGSGVIATGAAVLPKLVDSNVAVGNTAVGNTAAGNNGAGNNGAENNGAEIAMRITRGEQYPMAAPGVLEAHAPTVDAPTDNEVLGLPESKTAPGAPALADRASPQRRPTKHMQTARKKATSHALGNDRMGHGYAAGASLTNPQLERENGKGEERAIEVAALVSSEPAAANSKASDTDTLRTGAPANQASRSDRLRLKSNYWNRRSMRSNAAIPPRWTARLSNMVVPSTMARWSVSAGALKSVWHRLDDRARPNEPRSANHQPRAACALRHDSNGRFVVHRRKRMWRRPLCRDKCRRRCWKRCRCKRRTSPRHHPRLSGRDCVPQPNIPEDWICDDVDQDGACEWTDRDGPLEKL